MKKLFIFLFTIISLASFAQTTVRMSATTTGTDTYSTSYNPTVSAFNQSTIYVIPFGSANTSGTVTIDPDAGGTGPAIAIKGADGNDLDVGAIVAGGTYFFKFNGTLLRMIGGSGGTSYTRATATLGAGVTIIDWSVATIQDLSIGETKVIDSIRNMELFETIVLIADGSFSVTFSGFTASIQGAYKAGEEHRIYIQCLKETYPQQYEIVYSNTLYTGIPAGGTDEFVLAKASGADYDVEWVAGGSGAGDVTSASYAFSALTDGATVAWSVGADEVTSNRTLTIAGDRTFSAPTGMSSGFQGNVLITASAAQRIMTIPSGTGHKMMGVGDTTIKTIIIPSGLTFIVSWMYDGTNWWWWYID